MGNQFHAFLFVLGGASPSVCRTIPWHIESEIFKTYLITFCEMRWADPFCKLVICNPTRRRYWESVSSILLFGLGAAYVMQCIAIAMQYFFHIFASAGSIREISAQHQFETESSKRSTRRTADVFAAEDFAHENLQPHPVLQL